MPDNRSLHSAARGALERLREQDAGLGIMDQPSPEVDALEVTLMASDAALQSMNASISDCNAADYAYAVAQLVANQVGAYEALERELAKTKAQRNDLLNALIRIADGHVKPESVRQFANEVAIEAVREAP